MTEEQIEKTVWLNRAFRAKHAIGALESVRNEKRSMAALCGMDYENDGSTNGSGENRQEQKNINLCEIDHKIDQARKKLIRIYSEIETVINNVEDIELRTVLTYHYLSYMTWETVAEKMNCSVRTVKYKHKKALDKVCIVLHPASVI